MLKRVALVAVAVLTLASACGGQPKPNAATKSACASINVKDWDPSRLADNLAMALGFAIYGPKSNVPTIVNDSNNMIPDLKNGTVLPIEQITHAQSDCKKLGLLATVSP